MVSTDMKRNVALISIILAAVQLFGIYNFASLSTYAPLAIGGLLAYAAYAIWKKEL